MPAHCSKKSSGSNQPAAPVVRAARIR
jgi:hypothetical protein